jgi:hypothetical protein
MSVGTVLYPARKGHEKLLSLCTMLVNPSNATKGSAYNLLIKDFLYSYLEKCEDIQNKVFSTRGMLGGSWN